MITILLIDDDEDEFLFFSEALYKMDASLNCVHASSPASGLQILEKFTPGYIFVDMKMPKTTGLECITSIRALTALKKTPIVLYSGFLKTSEWKSAKQNGANGYLEKTSSVPKLIESLVIFFLKFNKTLFLHLCCGILLWY